MEYGIRPRGLGGGGGVGGGPAGHGGGWLESAAASGAYGGPLAAAFQFPGGAALLLNSLHALQSSAAAMELVWKPGKQEPPDEEHEDEEEEEGEEDERGQACGADRSREAGRGLGDVGAEKLWEAEEGDGPGRAVEEENEGSAESWKDNPMPVLSSWMLSAYTSMLSRLSAATASLEGPNLTSDSGSESDRSSRESSPGSVARQSHGIRDRPVAGPGVVARARKKRRATSERGTRDKAGDKEASCSTTGSATAAGQGKKRSLALQRVRYRYEREEYRCSLCSYACTIEKAFQRHLRAHARGTATESRVSCAVCGADRSSEVDLSKHMRRHRDNRFFCCDICIFRTVQLKKLIQHRRMHTGEKPHLCPHCAYRSARRDNLRSHVRRVHKKENLYCDTFSPRGMFIAPKYECSAEEEASPPSSASTPTPTPEQKEEQHEQQQQQQQQQQSSTDSA